MKIAGQNGVTKMDVAMVLMPSPTRKGQTVWEVIEEGMANKDDITLDIDARTGAVLKKTTNP